MSADNGIYILKTTRSRKYEGIASVKCEPYPVYRVAYANAIDNFDYYKNNYPYNLGAYMKDVWGDSLVYINENTAVIAANEKLKQVGYTEYGIQHIDASDMVFYGDM